MAIGGGTIQLPTISQRITVDGSGLDGMKGKLGGIGRTLGKGVALGAGAAAVAVGAFVAKGISGAVEVERGVREVVTLFGETGEAADAMTAELTEGVADLSNEVGIAQDEITGGLYSAISAGVPKDNAFEFMRVASQAAIGGVTDVETAVDGLSTIINAFGLEASDAEAVSDSMFAAVQGGKTTFEELSASMFNVAPAAAGLGIEFQDVNAAIATLTASGTPTSVATTQMRAALSELGKEGSVAGDAFAEIAGTTFPEFIAQGGTLEDALGMMGEAAGGNATELSNMFGSVEAGAAAAQLGITNAAKFSDELDRQSNAAGGTADAFATMEEGVGRKMDRLKNQLSNTAMAVGNVILPMISDAFDAVSPYIDAVLAGITALTEGGFGGLADTVASIFGGGEGSEFAGPISEAVDTVRDLFGQAVEFVQEHMGQVREIIAGVLEVVTTLWSIFGEDIMTFVRETFQALMKIIGGALDVIQGIINTVLGILTGDWSRAWDGIKQIFSGVWQIIRGIVDAAIARVRFVINAGMSLITAIFGGAWDNITSGVSSAVTAVGRFLGNMVSTALDKGREFLAWFTGLPTRVLSAVGDLGKLLLDAGRNIVQGLIDGITDKFRALRDTASRLASQVRDFLPFSPAKEGPLSGSGSPERAGRKIGEMLADGMADRAAQVQRASSVLASAASPSPGGLGPFGTGSGGRGVGGPGGMTFTGDIILPNVTDRSTADDLLDGLRQTVRAGRG